MTANLCNELICKRSFFQSLYAWVYKKGYTHHCRNTFPEPELYRISFVVISLELATGTIQNELDHIIGFGIFTNYHILRHNKRGLWRSSHTSKFDECEENFKRYSICLWTVSEVLTPEFEIDPEILANMLPQKAIGNNCVQTIMDCYEEATESDESNVVRKFGIF
ncbi:hypothetical protein JTB14_031377 [Gonioctena quinquepunctata]|nr:hypothetical protein JTB14_031377 [Gonioctena quinquepunctata]